MEHKLNCDNEKTFSKSFDNNSINSASSLNLDRTKVNVTIIFSDESQIQIFSLLVDMRKGKQNSA